ncbi:hypothetical protein D1Z90_12405 [Motilimonas pumila]|uniref:Uncharacterized protein n=1 Tax=Motilimonas pumila TaxID=2303987 RepID=A0A418YDP5_9GAMM|nr:hypothetical protein D1Z90_12405 [Motilimonas pumila]
MRFIVFGTFLPLSLSLSSATLSFAATNNDEPLLFTAVFSLFKPLATSSYKHYQQGHIFLSIFVLVASLLAGKD